MKKRYRIELHGCDNTTRFEMELTDEETALVKRLCNESQVTSTYACMPTMSIEPVETEGTTE